MTRIERLAALLEQPLLVAGPPYVQAGQANVRYLTGLDSSNAALLVEPDASATLFADFRYAARARAVPGVDFVETQRNLLVGVAEHVAGRRIAFEETNLPYVGYRLLQEAEVEAIPTAGLVESIRAVKDEDELESMRRAGALSDEVFEALSEERFSGRTERELAWWVERAFRDAGAGGLSFPVVVAAGETGTSPHAVPGIEPIAAGVLVIVDAGCTVDGYCSDCTRTFAVGEISDRLQELYALCLEAQLAGLAAVGPGSPGAMQTRPPGSRSRRRASAMRSVTASATASGSRSTRRRSCARSPRTCSSRGTSSRSSRASISRAWVASESRTSSRSRRTAPSGSRSSRRS